MPLGAETDSLVSVTLWAPMPTHPPDSPRILTISETRRKASRPATALKPTVARNSIPPATFFRAIIGRASIINKLLTTSNRALLKSLSFAGRCRLDYNYGRLAGKSVTFVPRLSGSLEQCARASPQKALNNSSMMVLKASYGRAN
jgi:hypothetical protein